MQIFPDLPGQDFGSKKTQRWDVKVQKSGGKKRKAMTSQVYPEWEIEVAYKALTKENTDKIMGFFGAVKGPLTPFLWRDLEDYQENGVRLGLGDGMNSNFYLIRNVGGYMADRVFDVVSGTLKVYVNGAPAEYTPGADGLVSLNTAPDAGTVISADFEYYWRVCFAEEYAESVNIFYDLYENKKIRLVTVE